MKKIKVKIHDITLREGDQAPLTSFNRKEKQIIALMLNELGVSMEVGFGASRVDYDNIKGVIEVFKGFDSRYQPYISSLGRTFHTDTEKSLEVLSTYKKSWIHIFMATPDSHINSKFEKYGKDLDERRKWVLEQIKVEIGKAKTYKDNYNNNLIIEFSPEAASDSAIDKKKVLDINGKQFEFLIEAIEKAIKAGAQVINIPDTVGNLLPHETETIFREIGKKTSHLKKKGYFFEFSCHIHNDLAMATANAIAAIRGGATGIEVTVSGIGERAGNTNLSEVIGIITEKGKSIMQGTDMEGYEVVLPGIRTELLGPITKFMEKILKLNKSHQSPFVGLLCDKDGSGVHNANVEVYGGSKDKNKYGGEETEEFFSPRGGANQIVNLLEKYGIKEEKRSEIIQKITELSCKKAEITKAIYSSNVLAMYLEEKGEFEIISIDITKKQVKVVLKLHNNEVFLKGEGTGENGVLDGIITAINNYIGEKTKIGIKSIKVVNKECIGALVRDFLKSVEKSGLRLQSCTYSHIKEIAGEDVCTDSKQVGISNVTLSVGGKEVHSVSHGNDVTVGNIKSIIYGSLSELMKK